MILIRLRPGATELPPGLASCSPIELWGERYLIVPPPHALAERAERLASLGAHPSVARVEVVHSPYVLSARATRVERTRVEVGSVTVGGRPFVVMAGPCAVESHDQVRAVAKAVREAGATMLRGGAFKPRTSPFAFQGLGREGLEILDLVGADLSMPIVSELMDQHELEAMDRSVDMLQIGMRNAQNFALLRDVGRLTSRRPVLLKSGAGTTIDEFLCAADHILCQGNPNVVLCLRGGVTHGRESRASINLAEIPALRRRTHLPIIVDPSHAAGTWELVPSMAAAALVAGADGLLVEVHHQPESACCDGKQALTPPLFSAMMRQLRVLARAMGRSLAGPAESVGDPFVNLALEPPPEEPVGLKRASPMLGIVGALLAVCALGACTPGAPPDRVLQGGDLTIYDSTSLAYDLVSPPIAKDPMLLERFREGDRSYALERVASPAKVPGTGGLGPLYVGRACTSCHQGAGRTRPTLFTHGGSGYDFSSHLAFMKARNGEYFPDYGRVLHDQAIAGAVPEGRLKVEYTEKCGTFPTEDREPCCLVTPRYWVESWYSTPPPEKDLLLSVRTPPRHVGMGLIMALDRDELIALSQQSYPEFGITPRLNWIVERNKFEIGVGGHKAQHSDLTVELGFSSDMGLTNHRFPDSVCKGQAQESANTVPEGIEASDEEMANVDLYLHGLGVPARRDVHDPIVKRGQEVFEQARCHLCHAPTLHTSPVPPRLIDGTPLPQLSNQTIHPYSDFMLHDMGPALGDDFDQFAASGNEWRTAPLWGMGLQRVVNSHMHLLHDGRARNVVEAILWHAQEEGAASYQIFIHLPKEDRDALVRFLMSL